ncbi:MAG: hypothetical protein AAF598_02055, partial [Bacteroidota bacterium]
LANQSLFQLDTSNLQALENVGLLYFDLNDYPNTRLTWQTFLEYRPNDPGALIWISKTYVLENRPKEAIEALELIFKDDPKEAAIIFEDPIFDELIQRKDFEKMRQRYRD